MYDIIIIGSGPAGLTAAIYASRAQLTAVVLEKDYLGSGQIAVSEQVDNYPGLPGIDGYTLGEKFREHAEQLGAKFENVEVDHIEQTAEGFTVFCKEGEPLQSRTILCASGTSYRRLDAPGGTLQGVSYCATCDGAFYKDKTVAVIGGGDTALGDAMYLSRMAKKVYLVHRRQEFRANQALQTAVQQNGDDRTGIGCRTDCCSGRKASRSFGPCCKTEHRKRCRWMVSLLQSDRFRIQIFLEICVSWMRAAISSQTKPGLRQRRACLPLEMCGQHRCGRL